MKHNVHGILSSILKEHAFTRTNGRVASDRTTTSYGEVLGMCFDRLHDLNFMIANPRNLTETHIKALCEYWYQNGKSVSTMQEYLSKLRVFSNWIGKKGMVKSLPVYLPNVSKEELKVSRIARESKSWSEKGVNIIEKIEQADAIDWRFGLMLRMMLAFGLRRKEVLHNRAWKADHGDKLVIFPGEGKGNRARDIYMDNHEQRLVLDFVKSKIGKAERLGWATTQDGKTSTMKQSVGRYNRLLAKIGITKLKDGVTGHGLRAQYAENAAIIAHMIPPTLGGTGGQMARPALNVKRAQISELLGHSRESITGAYYGSFGREASQDEADRCKTNITAGIYKLGDQLLVPVPADRMNDCMQLVSELSVLDIEVTAKQAHHLWHLHSLRHGHVWVQPRAGNAEAMEVEAMKISRGNKRSAPGAGQTDAKG
jgi:integrase